MYQGRWRGNDVAIKKLFSESLLDEQILREFRREVGMLSRLKPHKHLVRYFGACTQPPHLFIINEFIPRYIRDRERRDGKKMGKGGGGVVQGRQKERERGKNVSPSFV